jgi:signal transduction histidine kinase
VTGSLVGTVQRMTLAVWLVAMVAVGLGTALFLHAEGRASTDRMLLAAATSYAGPGELEAEGVRSPVHVGFVSPRELPARWAARARHHPVWETTETERVLVLAVELEEHEEHELDDEHEGYVLARAPRPTLGRTAGPFALGFFAVAELVTALASVVMRGLLLRAVEPLSRASRRVSQVVGAGSHARVEEDGPLEIRALLSSVNALLGRLDDAFQVQARFVAEAAHELRTPVAAMVGELEVALRRPRTPEQQGEVLQRELQSARRLSQLVEGLLLLARVDSGQAEQGRAREHAGQLAALAAARERAAIEGAGGTLTVEIASDPEVEVHEALWVAALANLLRNAAVHAPGTPVLLRVEEREGAVCFSVQDGGPGIPESAFDRSQRRSRTGLGVGLPLAREIARRHGGDCALETPQRVVLTVPAVL